MESSTVRIRPLRIAFLVKPNDKAALNRAFEINSGLWGGLYNFIIPSIKKLPQRYHERYVRKQSSPTAVMKGMLDAFQPDLLIEMEPGSSAGLGFSEKRTVTAEQFIQRDEYGRASYGIDMRSICGELYDKHFRFEQRHAPKVVTPRSTDPRYGLLFTALCGAYGDQGPTADFARHYYEALGGQNEPIQPEAFPDIFKQRSMFPLRVTTHKLEMACGLADRSPHVLYERERSL